MQKSNQHFRFVVKPLCQFKEEKNVNNIFAIDNKIKQVHQPKELYHFVGQSSWKSTLYGEMKSKTRMSRLKRDLSQHVQISMNEPSIQDDHFAMSTQKSKLSNFCLDQIDEQSRQRRTLEKFSQTRKMWVRNERSLKERINKDKSISFNAVKPLYVHPNPEKISLINDNIPEYWKNSLRDNSKYLKKHIRGNPFKTEIAEEMLQTIGGRRRLEGSVPPIAKICNEIALKGKNIKRQGKNFKSNLKFLEETLKSDYSSKDRWINEISCTQTLSSKFSFN